MKKAIYILSIILFAVCGILAQTVDTKPPEIIRVEAQANKGFSYPYYLLIPPELRQPKAQKEIKTLLVLPNNTGKVDDDLRVHEEDVKKRMAQSGAVASLLKTAVLMPVFPRPKTDWKIYTHALDRDSLITDKQEYKRFDLQLIKMIDNARERLAKEKLKFDKRILINGFSASGMFSNRFTFLHPDRVKAAAIGSPGGWPIAPVDKYKGKTLRYPIGIADFKTVTNTGIDLKTLQKVPLFIFMGDIDDNDSVVYDDGYEPEDKDLVFELFGKTPVERWEISKKLYEDNHLNASFKLYPNVKHTITPEMRDDIRAFLIKYNH